MNIGIILSGGSGQRFGAAVPKQYLPLCGREVISYSLDAFARARRIDLILVTAAADRLKSLSQNPEIVTMEGGSTRNRPLYRALSYIDRHYPHCSVVMINEAARPFIMPELTDADIDRHFFSKSSLAFGG